MSIKSAVKLCDTIVVGAVVTAGLYKSDSLFSRQWRLHSLSRDRVGTTPDLEIKVAISSVRNQWTFFNNFDQITNLSALPFTLLIICCIYPTSPMKTVKVRLKGSRHILEKVSPEYG